MFSGRPSVPLSVRPSVCVRASVRDSRGSFVSATSPVSFTYLLPTLS